MKGAGAVKKILGSLLILIATLAAAPSREYYFEATLSKSELYEGEAAILTVSFYRHRDINTVQGRFKPRSREGVQFEEFEIESESSGEYDIEHYVYLVRFEKAGKVALPVSAEVRKFNEQDLAESSNHRDAMLSAASSKERVEIKTFAVTVKPGAAQFPVGEFTLRVIPEEKAVLVHEPAHFTVTIEGEGDVAAVAFPEVTIEGAKVFVQEGERSRWLEAGKIRGRKSNQYAVVAEKTFTLPSLEISYFSPEKGEVETLRSVPGTVTVRSDPIFSDKALLDEAEPEVSPWPDAGELLRWGAYLLLFLSGFFAAKIRLRLPKRRQLPDWVRELKTAKTQKELLVRLLPHVDDPVCREYITRLEAAPVTSGEF